MDEREQRSEPGEASGPVQMTALERHLADLKRRLVRETVQAVGMLEAALAALWVLDKEGAREIRRRDDTIDAEEVQIESQCLRLMTLQQPFGRAFRVLAFIMKVNADVERVADHAASIAKVVQRIARERPPQWPTALLEMGRRVPIMCHSLLRALQDEDPAAAREVVAADAVIDELDRRLFDETLEWMDRNPGEPGMGIYIARVGRELERVGDLMSAIAEDIVYLATGEIIRHQKRRKPAGNP